MFVTPAYAQTAAAPAGSMISSIVMMVLMFAIFYFLLLRPQQKKAAQHRAMVGALKKGDRVVTGGGIVGRVTSVNDNEVEVEVAQNVRIRVVRGTIAQVVTTGTPVAANG